MAFQEQNQGSVPPAEAASPAPAAAPETDGKNLELSTPGGTEAQSSGGTEVRIPGLGKLGVLPKMDFGLELLYGANEQPKPAEPEGEGPADDLTIRGSMKHNF